MMVTRTTLPLTLTKTQSQSTKQGFTLLELLAVMGIMLILATITVTSYRSMVSGSAVTASLGHLRQTLALARQQAIMQGKSTYVVFYQDTNESWYVTCVAEGAKTLGAPPTFVLDQYRFDVGNVESDAVMYNLSEKRPTFSRVTSAQYNSSQEAFEIITDDPIWAKDDRYGWEISKRVRLPRGFKFTEPTPSTIRFKPNGTAVDVDGIEVGGGQKFEIYEEIRETQKYNVRVYLNGSAKVFYD